MKLFITIFLFLFFNQLSFAQMNVEDVIVGQWVAMDRMSDSLFFSFDKNKTMQIITPRSRLKKDGPKALMKYNLNLKEDPIQIDFYYYLDNFYNPMSKSEGIIEVLDNNTILLLMNLNKSTPARPKDFKNIVEAIVLLRSNVKNEVIGCDKFKDGKFRFNDIVLGPSIIDRQGDSQIQANEKGDATKFKVIWKEDCSYNLIPLESFVNNKWIADTTGLVMNIRIVKTKEKSYIYTGSYNKSRFRVTGELFKAKN